MNNIHIGLLYIIYSDDLFWHQSIRFLNANFQQGSFNWVFQRKNKVIEMVKMVGGQQGGWVAAKRVALLYG